MAREEVLGKTLVKSSGSSPKTFVELFMPIFPKLLLGRSLIFLDSSGLVSGLWVAIFGV